MKSIYVSFLGNVMGKQVAQKSSDLDTYEVDGIFYYDFGNWLPEVIEGDIPNMGEVLGGLDGSGWSWSIYKSDHPKMGVLVYDSWTESSKWTTYYIVKLSSVPCPTEDEASVFYPKWN